MKSISIDLPDKDYDLIKKIAKEQKRKLSDLHYLLLAEGFRFMFTEECLSIDKTEDEFTEEEKKQLAINEKLEKTIEGFWKLEEEDWKEKGWKRVRKEWSNAHYEGKGKSYSDDLIDPLVERLEGYAIEGIKEEK